MSAYIDWCLSYPTILLTLVTPVRLGHTHNISIVVTCVHAYRVVYALCYFQIVYYTYICTLLFKFKKR